LASAQIYIDNQLIDTFPDTVIAITYQINDVSNLFTRQANFSSTVKAPLTPKNKKIFGFPEDTRSTSPEVYRKLPCTVVENGVETVQAGIAVVNSVDQSINMNIYSGLLEPFTALEEVNLRDVDFSDLDYIWNGASAAAIANTTSGVIFPVVNYGKVLSTGNVLPVNFSYHSVFVNDILERAYSSIGFTKQGPIYSEDFFLETVIPAGADDFFCTRVEASNAIAQSHSADFVTGEKIIFDTEDFDQAAEYNPVTSLFVGAASYPAIRFKMRLFIQAADGNFNLEMKVLTNQGATQRRFFSQLSSGRDIVFESDDLETTIGSQIEFRVFSAKAGETVNVTFGAGAQMYNLISEPLFIIDSKIKIQDNLPDMNAKEFLLNIAQIRGLVFDSDNFEKKILTEQFRGIAQNNSKAIDWTDKLNEGTTPAVSFRFNSYGQTNVCQYADDDNVPTGLGRGSFSIDDNTLPEQAEVFSIGFAASKSSFKISQEVADIIRIGNVPAEKVFDPTPRVLAIKRVTGGSPSDVNYFDGVGGPTIDDYGVGYFEDGTQENSLGFDQNRLEADYSEFVETMNRFKQVSASFFLTVSDIHGLDLFVPIYLAQTNSYYIVNKVINFVAGKLTKVELIKLG